MFIEQRRAPLPFLILDKLYARKVDQAQHGSAPLIALHPKILSSFDNFARQTGTQHTYISKCADLLRLLDTVAPRSIVEMGSGRTSIIFGAWAARNNASYVAYEQEPGWREVVNAQLEYLALAPSVELVGVEMALPKGAKFARPIAPDTEFIYVDAPAVPKDREYDTATGKPAYLDVPLHLTAGHRPKAIAVDGRTETVDEIIPAATGYVFNGEYAWARQKRNLTHCLGLRRHSSFILRR